MIIRNLPDGSMMMINQSDHCRLSGVIAAHWGNEQFERPRRFESAVRAAMFHDSAWYRYETKPIFDASTKSTPSFMQVPLDKPQLDAFQWANDWLTDIDVYAGLMINKHRTGLWRGRYQSMRYPVAYNAKNLSPELEKFIESSESKQKEMAAQFDPQEFWIDYRLLQAWDFLSLYFCVNDPKDDYIELVPTRYSQGNDDGVKLTLTPQSNGKIAIDPYPFDARPLKIQFVYRHLDRQTFADEAEFRKAYYQAVPTVKSFEFV